MSAVADIDYRPSEDEPFMNDRQKAYFKRRLNGWKEDILRESQLTLDTLQQENSNHPDLADRASSETDRAVELRARDRQRKLILLSHVSKTAVMDFAKKQASEFL